MNSCSSSSTAATKLLRFNYPTLVKFIPVRTERYLSDARKQLDTAFTQLTDAGILAKVQWVQSKAGLPQILLHRGPLLTSVAAAGNDEVEIGEEDFTLDRIEDIQAPEWQLVSSFHQAWGNDSFTPSKAELDLARELLAKHGQSAMQELLPRLVKRLKLKWRRRSPSARSSDTSRRCLQEWQREKRRIERETQELQLQDQSRRQVVQKAQDQAVLHALWNALSPADQEEIRRTVLKGQPASLQKRPAIIERFCLPSWRARQGNQTSSAGA